MPIGKIAQKNPNLLQALQYSRAQGSWAKDRESKRPEVVASNWLSDPLDAKSCAGEMREFNSYNPRVKNLDIRFSISFDDSDRLTREQEKEFTMRVMKEMGVQEDVTQYAVIRHNDTAHPHHHVEINRVGLDGAAIEPRRHLGEDTEGISREKPYILGRIRQSVGK